MALTLAFSFRPLLFASNPMGGSSNTAGIGVDRCGRLRPLLTHAKTQAVGKVIATKSGKHHTAIKRNARWSDNLQGRDDGRAMKAMHGANA